MKKLLALTLALAMLLGVAACKTTPTEPPITDGATRDAATPIADVPLENVYTMTDLPFAAEGNSKLFIVNDTLYYDTITYDEDYNAIAEVFRAVDGANAESIFKTAEGETLAAFTADDAGNLWTATITMIPTSDMPQYTLTKYTPDGELLLAMDITDVVPPYGFTVFLTDGDGNLYLNGVSGLLVYHGETGDLAFTMVDGIYNLTRGADGRIVYKSTQSTQNPLIPTQYEEKSSLKTLDFAAKTGENPRPIAAFFNEVAPGFGDYAMVARVGGDLVGIRASDAGAETLVSCVNSDIDGQTIAGFAAFSDGSFIVSRRDLTTYQIVGFSRLTHNPDATLGGKTLITLGFTYLDPAINTAVLDFNRTSPDVRISLLNYDRYNTSSDYTLGALQIDLDLMAGTASDLFVFMPGDTSTPGKYASKGGFTDLYPFIDADETMNRGDLFQNVLDGGTINGELYRLPPMFYIGTAVGATEIFGTEPGVSYDRVRELLAEHPERQLMLYSSSYDLLRFLLRMHLGSLVDMSTFKAHFDTPEFAALLEFTKVLPTEVDWSNVDIEMYLDDMQNGNKNGKTLLQFGALFSPSAAIMYADDFNAEVTFIGYPSIDGTPSHIVLASNEFAINAKSPNKDAAWSFISYLMSPDRYDPATSQGIPLSRSVFEAALATATYPTEGGEMAITEAEREKTRAVIEAASGFGSYEDTIQNIVLEEAQAYYAGAKSAEETARVIQSRVGLYLAEQG